MATDNEMTVLELDDAENVAASDLLYLIQGDGATRDRKLTLEQLITFLSTAFTSLTFTVQGGKCELKGGSLTYTATSGKTVSLSFSDGLKIKADGGVAQVDGSSVSFTANSGAKVKLSYNGGLEVLNASGETVCGLSKDGVLTASYGAGFVNANAGVENLDVADNTLSTLIYNVPDMKYFCMLGKTDTATIRDFKLDVTTESYKVGEEILIYNGASVAISVTNSAGKTLAAVPIGQATRFILTAQFGWVAC